MEGNNKMIKLVEKHLFTSKDGVKDVKIGNINFITSKLKATVKEDYDFSKKANKDHTKVTVSRDEKCDFCGKPATHDGKTKMGPWAYMCDDHFKRYGVGTGLGKGQQLVKDKLKEEAEPGGEELNNDYQDDNEFGDADDITLSGNLVNDFKKVVTFLRHRDYPDFVENLSDVVKDPKLYTLLSKGFGNGELSKVKMSSNVLGIPVTQLLPSQSEIGLDNSLAYPLKSDCSIYFKNPVTIVEPIVTYRKSFIIDGHHRWSQVYMVNPKATISSVNFNYQETSPYRALRNFQGAIAVAHKDVPSATSKVNNVYEMSKEEIRAWIEKNIQDICVKGLISQGVAEDKEGVIAYLLNNALDLVYDNPPFANAPEREYMPQTDEKSIDVAQKGQTNI